MFATLRRSKRVERSLAVLVVASLLLSLLPSPAFAAAQAITVPTTQQTSQTSDLPPVPAPVPAPQWPEVGERPQYAPSMQPAAAPATLTPPSPAAGAETPLVTAAPVLPPLVLPQAPVTVTLGRAVGAAQVADLPLALQAADAAGAADAALTAQVQLLPQAQAESVSPLGLAFSLQLHAAARAAGSDDTGGAAVGAPSAGAALTLTIDYSRMPLAQVNDVGGRLAFYRARGCTACGQVRRVRTAACRS